MNNKKLISILQVVGTVLVLLAVILFVRYMNREDAADGQPHSLTVSSTESFRNQATPEPTATPEPKESSVLGVSEDEAAAFYAQIVWDEEFQKNVVEADTENHDDDPYFYQKVWLSQHPDFSLPGFENIYYEPSTGELEDASENEDFPKEYLNKTCEYPYGTKGGIITIGTETPSRDSGIQLDFSCSEATAENPVGFYILPEQNQIDYTYGPSDLGPATGKLDTGSNFIIPNHLLDNTIPAHQAGTCMGTFWVDELAAIGQRRVPDTLHVRAVNLTTGDLMAMFRVVIDYVDDQYQIVEVTDSDVSSTGELDAIDRQDIINDAYDFFTSTTRGPLITVIDPDYTLSSARVEKIPKTYFTSLYDDEQDPAIRSDYSNVDVYAVNMNIDGVGLVTAYYGPLTQVEYRFNSPTAPGSDELDLTLFGFDAPTPFSRETIMTINGYKP